MSVNDAKRPSRLRLHAVGLGLAGAYLAVLLATAGSVGYARDEGFYFIAARSYQRWFDILLDDPGRAMTSDAIKRCWNYNHEHPALMKTLFGFSNRILHERLDVLGPSAAFRLPGMLSAALVVYLLFLFGASAFGARAGLFAAAAFALMPRVFYHAHLACFDVPMTAGWLLVTYLYWRSLRSWKMGAWAGAAFGLALCVKLNAFFLPFLLALHYLALLGVRLARRQPLPQPFAFLFGLVLAPPIFLGHWPWLWDDTWHRLKAYVGFHASHSHYNTAWFGENIVQAPTPMALPLVMTLFTVPTVLLVLAAAGAILRLRVHLPGGRGAAPSAGRRCLDDGLDLLLVLGALFPIALISLPSIPKFGGTKHWMPAFPFFALYAGAAVARLMDVAAAAAPRIPARAAWALAGLVALAPPLAETAASHPFGLASYVPLIGGAPKAATLGMTRQFWGYTTMGVLPWLDEHVPKGGGVEFHDTVKPAVDMYKEEGLLRKDIQFRGLAGSDFALLHHELHMIRNEAWVWNSYKTIAPVHVLTYQGVPLVSVYRRPVPRGAKPVAR